MSRVRLQFDDPVEKYLPGFNAGHDPERAKVTVRMLLTHTSGEAPDVNLKDAWGLAKPDFMEGVHRALTTPLISAPGEVFRYSDVNFILLGYMVQVLSGEPLDVYAQEHIFKPLGMTETRYLPLAKACGPHRVVGAAIAWAPAPKGRMAYACPTDDWSTSLLARIAPEAHDDEGRADPATNPDYDRLLRGTVHDPTTRRMGGVAGHAGVFSTAHDVSLFAQALLDRLAGRPSNFPLKQSTLELMVTPEQPGAAAGQVAAANAAERREIAAGEKPAAPGLAPHYPAVPGQDLRGFGWDIDTAFSKPRGVVFPIGSFGHTGFTGTSLWMDPGSDTYVVLLANCDSSTGECADLESAWGGGDARRRRRWGCMGRRLRQRSLIASSRIPFVIPPRYRIPAQVSTYSNKNILPRWSKVSTMLVIRLRWGCSRTRQDLIALGGGPSIFFRRTCRRRCRGRSWWRFFRRSMGSLGRWIRCMLGPRLIRRQGCG